MSILQTLQSYIKKIMSLFPLRENFSFEPKEKRVNWKEELCEFDYTYSKVNELFLVWLEYNIKAV